MVDGVTNYVHGVYMCQRDASPEELTISFGTATEDMSECKWPCLVD